MKVIKLIIGLLAVILAIIFIPKPLCFKGLGSNVDSGQNNLRFKTK
jgi:hypothetical protein